ncbi:MAG: hypothetical protein PHR51_00015 [Patescibacteria group bacterium]|nr:hypothetical protein [Patescibacteria group bacterium]
MLTVLIAIAPPGRAPYWVRQAWVGLEIPLGASGSLSSSAGDYKVSTAEAMQALRKEHPKAARWWEENVLHSTPPDFLIFSRSCCILNDPSSQEDADDDMDFDGWPVLDA